MKLLHQDKLLRSPTLATLVWDGNDLIDVTSGVRLREDGSLSEGTSSSAYPFDRSIGLRNRDTFWSVAFSNRQTKAILLKNGRVHRELNRSFYFAHVYDYPIALALGLSEEVIVIHCPENFDTLEVQDAETGLTLAKRKTDKMEFHSRLTVSPSSKYLLDSGWFWHPVGGAWLCDLAGLLARPDSDMPGCSFLSGAEIGSAAFLDDHHVVVTSTDEVINDEPAPSGLGPRQLGLWSISTSSWRSHVNLDSPSGTLMPWRDWVISFYECPKAIEIGTGRIVHMWEGIFSGKQEGSIDLGNPPPPLIALDPQHGRFAVQVPGGVFVVSLDAQ